MVFIRFRYTMHVPACLLVLLEWGEVYMLNYIIGFVLLGVIIDAFYL